MQIETVTGAYAPARRVNRMLHPSPHFDRLNHGVQGVASGEIRIR